MKIDRLLLSLAAIFLLCGAGEAKTERLSSKALFSRFARADTRYRPFVRWWWNGDRVEAEELVRELHLLKEAGIGGVEINPISFPYGAEEMDTKALRWLSGEWIDMLKVVFDEAKKIDLQCDLIIGSGWPFGSESLPRDQRASVMLTYADSLKSGETLELSKYSLYKALDPGVTVVNARRNPELVSAYLVPDPIDSLSQAMNLTDRFDGDILTVDVPEGKWQLYAMVRFDSFASVINGAPGAAGSILNHMDARAVRGYLDRMADAIETRLGPLSKHLRAFFVDSMELEGCNWTSDFAEEFKARRGYDLMPWLPFTMFEVGRLGDVKNFEYGAKKGEKFQEQVNRVRFDFELTKAELLHERYTATFLSWCKEKGVKSRAQAYGRGFFPLESSLGYDIPEGESWTTNWLKHRLGEEMGDEDYRRGRGYTMINKYVSSAAHLAGNRLVSAEEMTNTYKVFTTSLEFLKLGSDMSAFSGITHSVWHGFNYSPLKARFPGWVQYGTFHNERNTWWPYVKLLNDYRARMSAMLQHADMVTDIAILPADNDLWTELGVQTDPFPVRLNIPYTSLIWEAVHKNGGGADYVSETILRSAEVRGGKLCYGPKEYANLFLVEVSGITPETLAKLETFVSQGGRVFCIGKYPEKSLGLKDYEARDAQIRALVERLKTFPDRFILLEKPSDGKYLEWYTDAMHHYGLPHAVSVSSPDRFLLQNHYLADDGSDFFLFVNANLQEGRSSEVLFPASLVKGRNAFRYDPATGTRSSVRLDKAGRYTLSLGPAESCLIVFNHLGKTPEWKPLPEAGPDSLVLHGWQLTLHQPEADSTWTAEMDTLADFKTLKDSSFLHFMGTVTYRTTFDLAGGPLPRYLDLGKVADICEVCVNGKELGTQWFGRRIYDLSGMLQAGSNTLEVKVTTLTGNYVQTLKENKVAQRFVINRKQPLVSAGLIGPVKLYQH